MATVRDSQNGSQNIDPEIITAFNNKSFTSIDSSFDGFSSHDSTSDNSKLNFWGVESFKKVTEKLAILENSLTIEKLSNDILKDLIHKLETKINQQFVHLNNDIDDLYDDLNSLDYKVNDIDYKIIRMDQYSRRESLVISGINKNIHQNDLENTVLNIINSIGLNISSYEVTACHRLFNKNNNYPPQTIIRFTNRKIVDFCLKNRDSLQKPQFKNNIKMNLRFYEHLSEPNETILKECSDLVKFDYIKSYFIRNGFVKIVVADGDMPFRIIHPHILHDKFKDYFDHENLYRT